MNNVQFARKYGPWVVIAGASEGIGFAFAESCAGRGLNVLLISRSPEKLSAASKDLQTRFGVEVRTLSLDLSAPGAMDSLDNFSKDLDVGLLVYNAALSPIGPLAAQKPEDIEKLLRLNCLGPVLAAQKFSARFAKRGRGGIAIMASMAGTRGSAGLAAYSASKAFLINFAESLWAEMRPQGVDVCAVLAGATATPGYLKAARAKLPVGTEPKLEAYVGKPEVVAEAALRKLGSGPRVIPGAVNKIGAFFMQRMLSARAAVTMMSKASGGLEDKGQG